MNFIDSILDIESNISVITEIELQAWNPLDKNDLLVYQQFVTDSTIFRIEQNVVAKTIEIKGNYRLKIADAIIAATALVNFIL